MSADAKGLLGWRITMSTPWRRDDGQQVLALDESAKHAVVVDGCLVLHNGPKADFFDDADIVAIFAAQAWMLCKLRKESEKE